MRLPCLVLMVWCALPAADPAPAAHEDSSTAFLTALARAPQVRALLERQQALRYLEGAAGRLPDPQLSLGYARKRTATDNWPMYDLTLEQPFPRWGERDAAHALAASATRLSEADVASEVAALAGDLASAVAEIDGLHARLAEGDVEQRRIAALAASIDARVASGDAGVLERLGIDTRRERLQLRLDDLRRTLADREADIRGRLALSPDAPLPPFAAPQPEAIDPAHTPAALDAEAKRLEALAALQEARALGHPETAVGVRVEREAADGGNEDTVGLTVSISLPIARGAIAAGEDAAHARLRAAERTTEAARWRTTTAVERARRAWAQADRAAQVADGLLTRAAAEQQTLVAALGSGGVNITALLDLHDRLAELRLEVIDARVAARQAQAELWSHVIPDLPPMTGVKP
jgi:outer membrane protein, heavy metal efflux system